MRILKFVHVDFLKVRSSLWILLLCLLGVVFLIYSPEISPLFAVGYGIFIAMVFATFPYNAENVEETGFLQMLPAKPGEQVAGHFVFSAAVVLLGFVLGFLAALLARALVPAVQPLTSRELTGFCLIMIAVSLVFVGAEDLMLTVFRFNSMRVSQFLRIIPAFLFFFAFNALPDSLPAAADGSMLLFISAQGPVVLLFGLLLFLLCALISVRIAARRAQS